MEQNDASHLHPLASSMAKRLCTALAYNITPYIMRITASYVVSHAMRTANHLAFLGSYHHVSYQYSFYLFLSV